MEWLSFGAKRVPDLHAEVRSGAVNLDSVGGRAAVRIQAGSRGQQLKNRRAAQQPALFDFVERAKALTVAEVK